jgi:hypothetical protein
MAQPLAGSGEFSPRNFLWHPLAAEAKILADFWSDGGKAATVEF